MARRPSKAKTAMNASTHAGAAVRNATKDAVRTCGAKTGVSRKDSDHHAKNPRPRLCAKRGRLTPRSSKSRASTARVGGAGGVDDATAMSIATKLPAHRNVPAQAHR